MAAGETDIDKPFPRFIYVCFSSSHKPVKYITSSDNFDNDDCAQMK